MSKVKIGVEVADRPAELFVGRQAIFYLLAFLQDTLGFFLVLPEIGGAGFLFEIA